MSVNPNVGFKFPFQFGANGKVATVGGSPYQLPSVRELDEAVQMGVRQIVLTGTQERVMLGQFGLGAERYVFHPLGRYLAGFLSVGFIEQVKWWEPRVTVSAVNSDIDTATGSLAVDATLNYPGLDAQSILKFRVSMR